MKKILKMAVALAMVTTLGVGISACGGEKEHKHKYDTWGFNEIQHWKYCDEHGEDQSNIDETTRANHDFKDGECVCGAREGGNETQTGKLPEENFEAAWAEAFDEKNFDDFKMSGTLYISFTDADTVEPEEDLLNVTGIRANGKDMYYNEGAGDMVGNGGESGESFILEALEDLFYGAKDHAADFTFDDEKGLYVWEQNMPADEEEGISATVTVCFSFKDGKIAHFVHDRIERFPNNEKYSGAVTVYRYDLDFTYGGQTVTPPNDQLETGE